MASIGSGINKALNINKEEQTAVYLMLLQTVFLGVFLSIFDISATAMFMDEFGEDMLPKAFLVSGLVGFTLTAAYSKLQAIIPFSRLIILNLLCISLITLFLRLGFDFYSGKILIFLVFIMMGPLNLLGIVGFWGMASRLFTLRQGKRLFGLIDSGQIIGIIVIMLMVPVLLNLLKDTKNLLFISSGSIIVALLIQIIISSKFNLNKSQEKNTRDSSTPVSLIKLFKIRYVRAMAMFVVLSMLAAFFMFYTFLPITKAKYSGEGEYTTFLGVFMASLMFFTLLFKTFAYSKLTKVYGLKLNLILPPAILGICTILAIIVGFLFGYAVESASFMLFFLLISLGRLFSVSLKSGIEVPSQKVLYQSMDVSIRHRVQVAVDGMVNEIAAILSGLVLLIIGLFDFFEPIHYSIFLLIITVIWIFVGLKLHKEYRQSLEVTLDKSRGNEKEKEKERENQFSENIGNYIADNKVEPVMANVMLDFAKELSPLLYTKFCESALLSGKEEISKQLLKRISSEQQFALAESLKKYINQEKNETLKNEATKIHSKLIEKVESNSTSTIIAELVSSAYPADKIMAANILSLNKNPELSKYLIVLLRDIFPEVRIAAIRASSLIKDKEFIPAIVDYLDSDLYHNYAYEALLAYGKEALPQIDQFFYKSGLNHKVQIQIIKLFGITGGKQAIKLLINKLNYYNHNIIIETCHSLNKCGYFAENQEEKAKINMILTDNIRIIAWNLNILVQLRENLNDLDLIRTMEQEIKKNYENIFLILSIAYNPKSVSHVKENLELETAEGISFALELLDLFIDENIKPILMIVFEDISEYERVRRFQDHFPLEKMEPHQILNSLINRDINWISRWSKAISLNAISKLENYSVGIDIVAHLFNNDKLMSELAAGIINQIDSKFYAECLERLDIQKRNSLMKILKNKEPENLLFHNVIFLKKISQFESIDEEILLEIVEEAKEIRLGNGDKIKISGSIKHNDILVIRTGALKIRKKGAMQAEILNNGIIIPLSQIPEIENELEAEELTIIINLPFATVCKYINYYPKISNLVNKIV